MVKYFLIPALILSSAVSFASGFSPTPMQLSAPYRVTYRFLGEELILPVVVTGVGGSGVLSVFTRDKGARVGKVQNGYLGWHYVNTIDTSVYISPPFDLAPGTNNVRWNGRDENGNPVPMSEYTYYLWAYDNRSAKSFAARKFQPVLHNLGRQAVIRETGPDGKPLANPFILYTPYGISRAKAKWIIGGDPADSTLIETCTFNPGADWTVERSPFPVPDDLSKVFLSGGLKATAGKSIGVWKYSWVPNGAGVLDTAWGKNGYAGWERTFDNFAGPASDGQYLYHVNNHYHDTNTEEAEFGVFDLNSGALLRVFDLREWWSDPNDKAAGALLNGGPNGMSIRNGSVILGAHSSCVVQMVNPLAENSADFVVWTNGNGDTILDHNFDPDSSQKWVCNSHGTPPMATSFEADANLFTAGAVYGFNAISFGLLGPDGSGIGYFGFPGDTDSRKFFVNFVDCGSPLDGMYSDNQASVSMAENPGGSKFVVPGLMYTAHDSMKGVISYAPAVAESVPAAFTVAQNTPNPFNPSTTISFTLAKAGKTTVEVYNAAGQKVDTILNANMNAGPHSVTWNAAKHSAGVYFYTVKSDDLSRTMKMTILR
ncbi:MAG: T9SS type A sorting domain-containing protein [Candidatus Latescibacterota bacterium]